MTYHSTNLHNSSLPKFILENQFKRDSFLQETPKRKITMSDTILHLICKGRGHKTGVPTDINGIVRRFDLGPNTYSSGYWDFSLEEGKKLIGGGLHLHESKRQKSTLGGTVVDVYEQELNEETVIELKMDYLPIPKRRNRVVFVFQLTTLCKNVEWRGNDWMMSYNGGIVSEHQV